MNRQEWCAGQYQTNKYRGFVNKKLKEWKAQNGYTCRCVAHHRDDNDEVRAYNEAHYELWGFDEDGEFIEGKYITFMTQSEHMLHHQNGKALKGKPSPFTGHHHSDDSRNQISIASSIQNQRYKMLYEKYKKDGGVLMWNDFRKALKNGDIQFSDSIINKE